MNKFIRTLLVGLFALGLLTITPSSAQIWTTVCRIVAQAGAVKATCPKPNTRSITSTQTNPVFVDNPIARVTPAPTPTPGGGTNGCGTTPPTFTNGLYWTTAWKPAACNTVWNTALPAPASAPVVSGSATMVANIWNSAGDNNTFFAIGGPGTADYAHMVYYAAITDPSVNVNCTTGGGNGVCNHTDNGGYPAKIYIPANACPAGGGDAQMAVVQPSASGVVGQGNEIDFWAVTQPPGCTSGSFKAAWVTNATITAESTANEGNFQTMPGVVANGGTTVGGQSLSLGQFTPAELNNSTGCAAGSSGNDISCAAHATLTYFECQASGNVYPLTTSGNTQLCTDSPEPHLGALVWYTTACATTRARTDITLPEKVILCSGNVFGAYFTDNGAGANSNTGQGGSIASVLSIEPALVYGQGDLLAFLGTVTPTPFGSWSNGIYSSSYPGWLVNNGGETWSPDAGSGGWAAHLKFLCPPPAPPSTTWSTC